MKTLNLLLTFIIAAVLTSCGNTASEKTATDEPEKNTSQADDYYFNFTVDGKPVHVNPDNILTSYNNFSGKIEFKIFAGNEGGPQLILTIPNDMSKPSTTPSGSSEAGYSISQGSVSLQDYPEKGDTFNSFDFTANPPLTPVPDAIIVTSSEKLGEEGRAITGTVNVVTIPGNNPKNDPTVKPYTITGKFRVKHLFKGDKF